MWRRVTVTSWAFVVNSLTKVGGGVKNPQRSLWIAPFLKEEDWALSDIIDEECQKAMLLFQFRSMESQAPNN